MIAAQTSCEVVMGTENQLGFEKRAGKTFDGRFLFPPQAQRHITDLYEDLRDGHNLISLLEVLSGETLVRPARPVTCDL